MRPLVNGIAESEPQRGRKVYGQKIYVSAIERGTRDRSPRPRRVEPLPDRIEVKISSQENYRGRMKYYRTRSIPELCRITLKPTGDYLNDQEQREVYISQYTHRFDKKVDKPHIVAWRQGYERCHVDHRNSKLCILNSPLGSKCRELPERPKSAPPGSFLFDFEKMDIPEPLSRRSTSPGMFVDWMGLDETDYDVENDDASFRPLTEEKVSAQSVQPYQSFSSSIWDDTFENLGKESQNKVTRRDVMQAEDMRDEVMQREVAQEMKTQDLTQQARSLISTLRSSVKPPNNFRKALPQPVHAPQAVKGMPVTRESFFQELSCEEHSPQKPSPQVMLSQKPIAKEPQRSSEVPLENVQVRTYLPQSKWTHSQTRPQQTTYMKMRTIKDEGKVKKEKGLNEKLLALIGDLEPNHRPSAFKVTKAAQGETARKDSTPSPAERSDDITADHNTKARDYPRFSNEKYDEDLEDNQKEKTRKVHRSQLNIKLDKDYPKASTKVQERSYPQHSSVEHPAEKEFNDIKVNQTKTYTQPSPKKYGEDVNVTCKTTKRSPSTPLHSKYSENKARSFVKYIDDGRTAREMNTNHAFSLTNAKYNVDPEIVRLDQSDDKITSRVRIDQSGGRITSGVRVDQSDRRKTLEANVGQSDDKITSEGRVNQSHSRVATEERVGRSRVKMTSTERMDRSNDQIFQEKQKKNIPTEKKSRESDEVVQTQVPEAEVMNKTPNEQEKKVKDEEVSQPSGIYSKATSLSGESRGRRSSVGSAASYKRRLTSAWIEQQRLHIRREFADSKEQRLRRTKSADFQNEPLIVDEERQQTKLKHSKSELSFDQLKTMYNPFEERYIEPNANKQKAKVVHTTEPTVITKARSIEHRIHHVTYPNSISEPKTPTKRFGDQEKLQTDTPDTSQESTIRKSGAVQPEESPMQERLKPKIQNPKPKQKDVPSEEEKTSGSSGQSEASASSLTRIQARHVEKKQITPVVSQVNLENKMVSNLVSLTTTNDNPVTPTNEINEETSDVNQQKQHGPKDNSPLKAVLNGNPGHPVESKRLTYPREKLVARYINEVETNRVHHLSVSTDCLAPEDKFSKSYESKSSDSPQVIATDEEKKYPGKDGKIFTFLGKARIPKSKSVPNLEEKPTSVGITANNTKDKKVRVEVIESGVTVVDSRDPSGVSVKAEHSVDDSCNDSMEHSHDISVERRKPLKTGLSAKVSSFYPKFKKFKNNLIKTNQGTTRSSFSESESQPRIEPGPKHGILTEMAGELTRDTITTRIVPTKMDVKDVRVDEVNFTEIQDVMFAAPLEDNTLTNDQNKPTSGHPVVGKQISTLVKNIDPGEKRCPSEGEIATQKHEGLLVTSYNVKPNGNNNNVQITSIGALPNQHTNKKSTNRVPPISLNNSETKKKNSEGQRPAKPSKVTSVMIVANDTRLLNDDDKNDKEKEPGKRDLPEVSTVSNKTRLLNNDDNKVTIHEGLKKLEDTDITEVPTTSSEKQFRNNIRRHNDKRAVPEIESKDYSDTNNDVKHGNISAARVISITLTSNRISQDTKDLGVENEESYNKNAAFQDVNSLPNTEYQAPSYRNEDPSSKNEDPSLRHKDPSSINQDASRSINDDASISRNERPGAKNSNQRTAKETSNQKNKRNRFFRTKSEGEGSGYRLRRGHALSSEHNAELESVEKKDFETTTNVSKTKEDNEKKEIGLKIKGFINKVLLFNNKDKNAKDLDMNSEDRKMDQAEKVTEKFTREICSENPATDTRAVLTNAENTKVYDEKTIRTFSESKYKVKHLPEKVDHGLPAAHERIREKNPELINSEIHISNNETLGFENITGGTRETEYGSDMKENEAPAIPARVWINSKKTETADEEFLRPPMILTMPVARFTAGPVSQVTATPVDKVTTEPVVMVTERKLNAPVTKVMAEEAITKTEIEENLEALDSAFFFLDSAFGENEQVGDQRENGEDGLKNEQQKRDAVRGHIVGYQTPNQGRSDWDQRNDVIMGQSFGQEGRDYMSASRETVNRRNSKIEEHKRTNAVESAEKNVFVQVKKERVFEKNASQPSDIEDVKNKRQSYQQSKVFASEEMKQKTTWLDKEEETHGQELKTRNSSSNRKGDSQEQDRMKYKGIAGTIMDEVQSSISTTEAAGINKATSTKTRKSINVEKEASTSVKEHLTESHQENEAFAHRNARHGVTAFTIKHDDIAKKQQLQYVEKVTVTRTRGASEVRRGIREQQESGTIATQSNVSGVWGRERDVDITRRNETTIFSQRQSFPKEHLNTQKLSRGDRRQEIKEQDLSPVAKRTLTNSRKSDFLKKGDVKENKHPSVNLNTEMVTKEGETMPESIVESEDELLHLIENQMEQDSDNEKTRDVNEKPGNQIVVQDRPPGNSITSSCQVMQNTIGNKTPPLLTMTSSSRRTVHKELRESQNTAVNVVTNQKKNQPEIQSKKREKSSAYTKPLEVDSGMLLKTEVESEANRKTRVETMTESGKKRNEDGVLTGYSDVTQNSSFSFVRSKSYHGNEMEKRRIQQIPGGDTDRAHQYRLSHSYSSERNFVKQQSATTDDKSVRSKQRKRTNSQSSDDLSTKLQRLLSEDSSEPDDSSVNQDVTSPIYSFSEDSEFETYAKLHQSTFTNIPNDQRKYKSLERPKWTTKNPTLSNSSQKLPNVYSSDDEFYPSNPREHYRLHSKTL